MIDFKNINYLKQGNKKQGLAYKDLTDLNIFDILKKYSPILTGTIPIGIDIENSDLDIACYCKELESFKNWLIENFSSFPTFEIKKKLIRNRDTIISRFNSQNFTIEIFGQNRAVQDQEAYKHMLIENKILEEKGEAFQQQIIKLKQQGYKTEPAFAKLLGIEGDPYLELLKYDIK